MDDDSGGRLPKPLPDDGFGAPHIDEGRRRPVVGEPELKPEDAARLERARKAHGRARAAKKRQRRLGRLVLVGAVAVFLLLCVELVGRFAIAGFAEDEFETDDARSTTVELTEWAVVPTAVGLGRINDLTVEYEDLETGTIVVPLMKVEMSGADLDISDLLSARKVTINGADRIHMIAGIDADTVTEIVGFDSVVRDGQVLIGGPGESLQPVEPALEGRVVHFQGGFGSFDLPVPEERWLPCEPIVRVVDSMIQLECYLEDLPTAMGGSGASE